MTLILHVELLVEQALQRIIPSYAATAPAIKCINVACVKTLERQKRRIFGEALENKVTGPRHLNAKSSGESEFLGLADAGRIFHVGFLHVQSCELGR